MTKGIGKQRNRRGKEYESKVIEEKRRNRRVKEKKRREGIGK